MSALATSLSQRDFTERDSNAIARQYKTTHKVVRVSDGAVLAHYHGPPRPESLAAYQCAVRVEVA